MLNKYNLLIFYYFEFMHNKESGPLVKCLVCHEDIPMHELRNHADKMHGKRKKVGHYFFDFLKDHHPVL